MTDLADYQIFARVARRGSMSAAGREMGLSPAVVSKRISQLEQQLGVRLFHRTTRQLALTEEGAGFFRRVVDILNLVEEAETFVQRRGGEVRGRVRIALGGVLARRLLVPRLEELYRRHPAIELSLSITEDEVDLIRDGYDIALRGEPALDPSLMSRPLLSPGCSLLASTSYVERQGEPRSPEDLHEHDCLFVGEGNLWQLEGQGGESEAVRVRGPLASNSGEIVLAALNCGLGIALCPAWQLADHGLWGVEAGRSEAAAAGEEHAPPGLKRILVGYTETSFGGLHAVLPAHDHVPAKTEALIDFLREVLAEAPGAVAAEVIKGAMRAAE